MHREGFNSSERSFMFFTEDNNGRFAACASSDSNSELLS